MNALLQDLAATPSFEFFVALGLRCLIAATLVLLGIRMWTLVAPRSSAARRHRMHFLGMVGLVVLPIFALATSGLPVHWQLGLASPFSRAEPTDRIDVAGGLATTAGRDEGEFHVGAHYAELEEGGSGAGIGDAGDRLAESSLNSPTAIPESVDASPRLWPRATAAVIAMALLTVWLAGVVLLLLVWVVDAIAAFRWTVRAVKISDGETLALFSELATGLGIREAISLRCSERFQVPLALGNWRSTVLLPSGYGQWPRERLRVVLMHELVHIRRRDVLAQSIARVACALYWFHPLVWMASMRMRIERELACDDAVLVSGESAVDYAEHLVEIASSIRGRVAFPFAATAMASRPKLTQRVAHLMRTDIDRGAASNRFLGVQIMTSLLLVLAVVSLSPAFAQLPPPPEAENEAAKQPAAKQPAAKQPADKKPADKKPQASKQAKKKGLLAARRKGKAALLEKYGGSNETEAAVALGLKWISKQQRQDGSWTLQAPPGTGGFSGGGLEEPAAATAMAMLALQGAGNTHQKGKYKHAVVRGLTWLLNRQRENGEFPGRTLYTHGLCLNAVADLYAISGDEKLRKPLQKAVDFAISAQDPKGGGWRYRPRMPGDLSVTGWVASGLVAARNAKLEVPKPVLALTSQFLDELQVEDGALYPYVRKTGPKMGTTAIGLLCRQGIDRSRATSGMTKGVETLAKNASISANRTDFYFWYHATQVFHNYGGKPWEDWNTKMLVQLPAMQIVEGDDAGSWPTKGDRWGSRHGPLLTTCLAVLSLEVYYRRPPALPAE